MPHISRLQREKTALAVIDMQEGFRSIIGDFDGVARRIATAVQTAHTLKIPVVVTEQYPHGLKRTAQEIVAHLEAADPVIEKLCFSACGADGFVDQLTQRGVKQVLVCGIEAHICVTQTALDLLERDFEVHLILDCITARFPHNKQIAVERLTALGAVPSSLEMALFELLKTAGTSEFKAVQALLK